MLNLSGITVRLGGRTIIDDATAKLPPRGRIGLIGRNGAGKSTLVRVIAGMLEADSGLVDHAARQPAGLYRAGSTRRRCQPVRDRARRRYRARRADGAKAK